MRGGRQRRGLHSHHSLRYRRSSPAGHGAPMQGWASVGIKKTYACKHEPKESQRCVCDWGAALRVGGGEWDVDGPHWLLSGLQNSLAGSPG